MKAIMIWALLFTLPLQCGAAGSADWNETIDSELGKFAVSVKPAEKKIEVKKVAGTEKNPPHLRVKILRKQDRPLELRLKAVERVDSPLYFTGSTKNWNESYTGLELEFSFDRKTWKKLGRVLKKAIP